MGADMRAHWERVYTRTPVDRVGWYRPHLDTSLRLIEELDLSTDAHIIDVGGGASTLVDDLLAMGFTRITVLDISPTALAIAKQRLGNRARQVQWLEGDITTISLPQAHYDVWHDRAVFHFLVDPVQREQYLQRLRHALKPGGHLIIATFSPAAPPKCSGLPVERYTLDRLRDVLGGAFEVRAWREEEHITPGGVHQPYLYACFYYRPD